MLNLKEVQIRFLDGIKSIGKYAAENKFETAGALYFGANALFGYDPDDEDRYKKLRAKSGPLPTFGTDENNDPFKFGGWASNHMLLLMTSVRAENQQFIPLPGLGLKEYAAMMDLKSVAFGPTISSYVDILEKSYCYGRWFRQSILC